MFDHACSDEGRDRDSLPEREEEDAFDANKFRHRSKRNVRVHSIIQDIAQCTHRNGFRSSLTHIQNNARQYKLKQMLILYTILMYKYPASALNVPSLYSPTALSIKVHTVIIGFTQTYAAEQSQHVEHSAPMTLVHTHDPSLQKVSKSKDH